MRVFISHSAKDPHAREVLERLSQDLRQSFAVRVDRDDLNLGDHWRAEINTWLGYCEAAVVLLSEDALQSPYVAYEVSILAHRAGIQPQFPVIPIFLGVVDYARVEQSRLSPSRIQDLQSVVHLPDAAGIVASVVSKLRQAQAELTPVDKQADVLTDLLEDVPEYLVREAAAKLNVDLGSWSSPSNQKRNLALKMLSAGMQAALKVLLEIRVAWQAKPQRLNAAIELIACSWVDLPTAQKIPAVARNKVARRALAIKARAYPIGAMYVMRAGAGCAARSPLDPWPVAPVNGVLSETAFDDLRRMIRGFLAAATNATDEELDEFLKFYEEAERPVFVLLDGDIVTRQTLTSLRDSFPTVTFILLTGARETPADYLITERIEMLESKVPGDDEGQYCKSYERSRSWLRRGFEPVGPAVR